MKSDFYFKRRFVILSSSSTVLDDGVHTDSPPPPPPPSPPSFFFVVTSGQQQTTLTWEVKLTMQRVVGSAGDVAMSTGADVTETRPYGTQKGMCIFYSLYSAWDI